MGKISEKHRIFADAYLASQLNTEKDRAAEAEVIAGYKPGGGARLLRLPDVREYIEKQREVERTAESIMDFADSEEIAAIINSIVAEYKDSGGLEQPLGEFIASKQAKGETKIASDNGATSSQEPLRDNGCTLQERLEKDLRKILEKEMVSSGSQRDEIAGPEKVAAFLTAVMNGGDPDRFSSADLRDQMKAAEFLAKYHGMFSKEQTEKEPVLPVIISGDDSIES